MTREILFAAALAYFIQARAVLVDEGLHPIAVGAKLGARCVDVRVQAFHYQPQQSVLNLQAGQRHTACIRYISAPQRSHFIESSAGCDNDLLRAETTGVTISRGEFLEEGESSPAL